MNYLVGLTLTEMNTWKTQKYDTPSFHCLVLSGFTQSVLMYDCIKEITAFLFNENLTKNTFPRWDYMEENFKFEITLIILRWL